MAKPLQIQIVEKARSRMIAAVCFPRRFMEPTG